MLRTSVVLTMVLLFAGPVEARRSLMDDVMGRPSAYTQNRLRLDAARTRYRIEMMQLRLERERLRNERLRLRQDRSMPRGSAGYPGRLRKGR